MLPDGITRDHLVQAIRDLDDGAPNPFAASTHYDVLYDGRRYAPKAVVARAAFLVMGKQLTPDDFAAGLETKCFRILEGNGFDVIEKTEALADSRTYLLGWNPKKFPWGTLEDELLQVRREGSLPGSWSVGNNKSIQPGDRLFLIRLGVEPRGMVGSGYATSSPYPGEHWDPDLAVEGHTTNYVDFTLDTLSETPLLPMELLKSGELAQFHWSIQMSGVRIKDEVAHELEAAWLGVADSASGVGFPGESSTAEFLPEGARSTVFVNRYERNPKARAKCIQHYGRACSVCGMTFAGRYGSLASSFIQVHHLVPVSELGSEYLVDPIRDLRPVCPNCHAVLHLTKPPMSLVQARAMLDAAGGSI